MEAHPVLKVVGADIMPWEQLPLLVRKMILRMLPYTGQLKFRLVSKERKKEVEEILREKQVFHALKWLPDSFMGFHESECLCVYDMLENPYEDTPDQPTPHVKYPPALESATDNPFPTGSLVLTSESGYHCNGNPRDPLLPHSLENFAVSFGVHLTVLTLYELRVKFSTLVGMLENTPNIKVLRMNTLTISETQRVKCYSNTFSRNLPNLPRLQSLVLDNLNAFTTEHGPRGNHSTYIDYEYFYQSYTRQLVKLVINCDWDNAYLVPPLKATFPKLDSLILGSPPKSALLINSAPPALVDLVILGKDFDRELMPNFYDVSSFIDKFSKTLVNLCLNIPWEDLTEGLTSKGSIRALYKFCKSKDYVKRLRRLKTLTIPFTKGDLHMTMISWLLRRKCPALEKLYFVDFLNCTDEEGISEEAKNVRFVEAKNLIENQHFWNKCPSLKEITVFEGADYTDYVCPVVYSTSRPQPE